ncbi:uncharacterized protein BCR38DRAFT_414973 [Pseudomassariella vexata]|uniref:Uncharacterized protein n=1 Tax=Pseudomassariella vexata TaxID=1141098 RepID=A0A1Y2D7Z5_9PEZI|nr:uncharacterized protein BCR38DRAFT_414973 [Pseudomassariella vexata]ORY55246.1 hypothetical protein BCR38DRAFT_414973 [Pseudomassariella vexata]
MRFHITSLVATAALLPLAKADFYIYAVGIFGNVDPESPTANILNGYGFFNGPPSCDDVINHYIWQISSEDLSGGRSGVRCEGCSLGYGGDVEPTELEWNNEMGHFTWYLNRNGDFVDTDDVVKGNCVVDGSDSFDCVIPPGITPDKGISQLFCTSDLNADAVNN